MCRVENKRRVSVSITPVIFCPAGLWTQNETSNSFILQQKVRWIRPHVWRCSRPGDVYRWRRSSEESEAPSHLDLLLRCSSANQHSASTQCLTLWSALMVLILKSASASDRSLLKSKLTYSSSFSSCWPTDCVTSVKVGADDPSLICIKSDWLTFDLTLHPRAFSCQVSSLRMSIQRKFPRTRTMTCSAAGRGWRGREVAGRTRRTERQHPRREKVSSCFHLLPSDCANLSNLKPTKAAKGYREEILAFS